MVIQHRPGTGNGNGNGMRLSFGFISLVAWLFGRLEYCPGLGLSGKVEKGLDRQGVRTRTRSVKLAVTTPEPRA
jgi:hypothetical protein